MTLRVPKIFNLRTDPFEEADHIGMDYQHWRIDRVFLLVPAQQYVGQFLATFKEFPPSQKAGSFSLDQVMEKLTRAPATGSTRTIGRAETGTPGRIRRRRRVRPVDLDIRAERHAMKLETRRSRRRNDAPGRRRSHGRADLPPRIPRRLGGGRRDAPPARMPVRGAGGEEDLHHPAHQRHALELHRDGAGRGLHAVHARRRRRPAAATRAWPR